jgi:hypothetical protein
MLSSVRYYYTEYNMVPGGHMYILVWNNKQGCECKPLVPINVYASCSSGARCHRIVRSYWKVSGWFAHYYCACLHEITSLVCVVHLTTSPRTLTHVYTHTCSRRWD